MTYKMKKRLIREQKTVDLMIRMYCRAHHSTGRELCDACEELSRYARRKNEICPFGALKPICSACTVHCYKPAQREKIHQVMRYAGPRMIWRHPWLAIQHLLDNRPRL